MGGEAAGNFSKALEQHTHTKTAMYMQFSVERTHENQCQCQHVCIAESATNFIFANSRSLSLSRF